MDSPLSNDDRVHIYISLGMYVIISQTVGSLLLILTESTIANFVKFYSRVYEYSPFIHWQVKVPKTVWYTGEKIDIIIEKPPGMPKTATYSISFGDSIDGPETLTNPDNPFSTYYSRAGPAQIWVSGMENGVMVSHFVPVLHDPSRQSSSVQVPQHDTSSTGVHVHARGRSRYAEVCVCVCVPVSMPRKKGGNDSVDAGI